MFCIFEKFDAAYIPAFLKRKSLYLVSQTYHAAADHFSDEVKTNILLSDYPDLDYARVHLNAVKKDKFGAVIDLTKPAHLKKLKEMLDPGSPYNVYWAAIKDPAVIKRRLEKKYSDQLRRYIAKETTWRLAGDEKLKADLQVIFGNLFIIIKRGRDILRIEIDQLEKA